MSHENLHAQIVNSILVYILPDGFHVCGHVVCKGKTNYFKQ